jgi:SAM-dependent methyltransferase
MLRALSSPVRRRINSLLKAAGIDFHLRTNDRWVLEKSILPAIARMPEYHRILFIGCEWYTRGYSRFFAERDYWTLEIDPSKRKYGARQHIVDAAENLAVHFEPGSLDFILCNGVIGWGLNESDGIERMLDSCWHCLSDGGVLLLGWNNVPEHLPVAFSELRALGRFQPYCFPELGTAELTTDTELRHTYSFRRKVSHRTNKPR